MVSVTAAPPPTPRSRPQGGAPSAALVDDAERLRLAPTRLARILRQETHTGLTPTQVAALATLQRLGPVPLKVLAEAERISAPTATKVVDKLAEADLVERRPHPEDRRVALVAVTEAGHELLAATRRHKTTWLATRLAGLEPDERRCLIEAVEVIEHLVAPESAPDDTADDATGTDPAAGRGTGRGAGTAAERAVGDAKARSGR